MKRLRFPPQQWLLGVSFVLLACSPKPYHSHVVLLPDEIRETSGLACLENGHFLTVNDSGHGSILFEFDPQGRILRRQQLPIKNMDWEALAQDHDQIWIGDIGNNNGHRREIQLWQLPQVWYQTQQPVSIAVSYPDYPKTQLQPYQHDFDAEALAYANGALWIFSKSWQNDDSQVYKIQIGHQMRKVGTVTGLAGLVTDAAFSASEQLFVLVGYVNMRKHPLQFILQQDYQPFIALVNTQFEVIAQQALPNAGQVEAVCIDPQQQIWLTQEQTQAQPAMFWRFGHIKQLISTVNKKS